MKPKVHVWMGIMLMVAFVLAACGGGDVSSEDESTSTSSGNDSAVSTELMLDPANAEGENVLGLVNYLYEGLMREQDGNVTGALAESVTVSEDGLDYIFSLRSGVTFHDGTALTADVVVANFNRWFDPKDVNRGSGDFAAWAEDFGGFKGELLEDGKPKSGFDGIEKVDGLTVLVHLNTADPNLLTKLTDAAYVIVSPAAFAGGDGGTGPYRFSSSSDTTITLEPFADYWDASAVPSQNMEIPAP